MANHKSALKRIGQTEKRTASNKSRISRIKTFIKKFIASLGSAGESSAFSEAQSEIQKGVTKGVIHQNAASRKVSRMNKMLKSSAVK